MKMQSFPRLLCGVAVLVLALATGWSYAQKKETVWTPGELLPADSVFYLRLDGSAGHEAAYEQTVAYQAFNESGLMNVFDEILAWMGDHEETSGVAGIVEHLQKHGVSVAVAVDAPEGKPFQAWATVVVPFAAEGAEMLGEVVTQFSNGQADVRSTKVKGRQVRYIKIDNPLVELGWWAQGENLVIAAGMNAIANSIAVADGERPNLTSHPLWEKYSHLEDDFEVTTLGWVDFKSLQDKFGNQSLPPIPGNSEKESPKVSQILKILGLTNLNHVASLSGYRGDSLWSEVMLEAPGEHTGLLSLLDQESFQLEDLPAMPLHHLGLMACSFDTNQAYATILKIVRELAQLGPKNVDQEIDKALEKLQQELGFAPAELLSSLGNLHCLYTDSSQGMFGLGAVSITSVQDQGQLVSCLEKILGRIIQEAEHGRPGHLELQQVDVDDRTVFYLRLPKFPFISPTISVGEDWLVIGLIPQAVDAQIMRHSGRLFSWSIEEDLAETFEMLPAEFTSLNVVDPASTYKLLLGLAPTFINAAEMGLRESGIIEEGAPLPVDVNAFPPAELVVQNLFMNVGVTTREKEGWHGYSRQSAPGLPLIGGSVTPGAGVGGLAIGTALLLPAVQQARQAAMNSQSKNNMKQLGLAMHNYHDVFNHFPEGTVPNADLQLPEERLSWCVSLFPFLDQAVLYNQIDSKSGWNAAANKEPLSQPVNGLLNPAQRQRGEGPFGKTNYVGIGGLGKDGPTLPANDPKAGVFGYNRFTRLRDITDGTSNTVMITESTDVTNWGEGGRATIRAFTKQPYLNGPDGVGSPRPGPVNFLFADGAVRGISEKVDPKIIEAISTIAGGEIVGEF